MMDRHFLQNILYIRALFSNKKAIFFHQTHHPMHNPLTPSPFAHFLMNVGRWLLKILLLFVIYLFYLLPEDLELEFINEILYLIIIPVIFISGSILLCLLLGLPIRLIPKVKQWWYSKRYLGLAGLLLGLLLIVLSSTVCVHQYQALNKNGNCGSHNIPNYYLLITGWFVLSFFLCHFSVEAIFAKKDDHH
jgi:hypothetical protein